MFAVIFGRPGCPYCVRAKELAEKLSSEHDDFNFRYIDIHAEGITKADLEKTVGKPVETVPQIFVDQKHRRSSEKIIVGCYFTVKTACCMDIYPFQRILNRKFFPVFPVFIDGYADELYLLMGENLFLTQLR